MAVTTLVHERVPEGTNLAYGEIPAEAYDVTYEGAVLDTYEDNGYHDSDFYAVVWDEGESAVKSVLYATTRGWTYRNGVTIDATDEVKAKAEAWAADYYENLLTYRAKDEAQTIGKGDVVEVTGGRTRAGETGTVFWVGESRYGGSRWTPPYPRYGVEFADGERVFMDNSRLKAGDKFRKVNVPAVDTAKVRADAERWAAQRNWKGMVGKGGAYVAMATMRGKG